MNSLEVAFDNTVVFQNIFYLKIYQNNIFFYYFNTSPSKQFKKYKKIILNKKIKILKT